VFSERISSVKNQMTLKTHGKKTEGMTLTI